MRGAQLVEAVDSKPTQWGFDSLRTQFVHIAQLAEARRLGRRCWGFESLYGQKKGPLHIEAVLLICKLIQPDGIFEAVEETARVFLDVLVLGFGELAQ